MKNDEYAKPVEKTILNILLEVLDFESLMIVYHDRSI